MYQKRDDKECRDGASAAVSDADDEQNRAGRNKRSGKDWESSSPGGRNQPQKGQPLFVYVWQVR